MTNVLLLNASYQPLTVITPERAVNLLLSGRAIGVEGLARVFRTVAQTFEVPSVVRLETYVNVPSRKATWSKQAVLIRDKYTCIYCGNYGNTVEHIVPKSRGGKNTWGNTACSCEKCNRRKGNKTVGEAGMKLLWEPKTPRTNMVIIKGNFPKEWKKYVEFDKNG